MNVELLKQILKAAEGLDHSKGTYTVSDGYDVSVYLAQEGQGLMFADVKSIRLHDGFAQIASGDRRQVYVPMDHIQAVASRAPRDDTSGRAGFA